MEFKIIRYQKNKKEKKEKISQCTKLRDTGGGEGAGVENSWGKTGNDARPKV